MIWRPNICPPGNPGCVLEWASGSNWAPDEPWQFQRVCAAHDRPTKQESLAALEEENKRMSYARDRLRQALNLPDDDASIAFTFDADRKLTLIVPPNKRAAFAAARAAATAAARQIDPDVTIE